MNSFLFGRKQYSPICNVEEGDESSLKLKLQDGVSPMTYKKLKEMGYTSDDWQNWSDDEKVEKSQKSKESASNSSSVSQNKQESNTSGGTNSSFIENESKRQAQAKQQVKELTAQYKKLGSTLKEMRQKSSEINKAAYSQINNLYPETYNYMQKNDMLLYLTHTSMPEDAENDRKEYPLSKSAENDQGYKNTTLLKEFVDAYNTRTGSKFFSNFAEFPETFLKMKPEIAEAVKNDDFFNSLEFKMYKQALDATCEYASEDFDINPYGYKNKFAEVAEEWHNTEEKLKAAKRAAKPLSEGELAMIKEIPEIASDNPASIFGDIWDEVGRTLWDFNNNMEPDKYDENAIYEVDKFNRWLNRNGIDYEDPDAFNSLSVKNKYTIFKKLKEVTDLFDRTIGEKMA